MSSSIPIIRLDDEDEEKTVQTLRQCCLEHGFFYLGGHGISNDLLNGVLAEATKFFALPLEEKCQLYDSEMSRGYTRMGGERLGQATNQPDTKEGYYIGNHIPKDDPRYNPSKLKGPNVWPTPDQCSLQDCEHFRSTIEEYYSSLSKVGLKVVRLLARAIGDSAIAFDSFFTENFATVRLLHYDAVPSQPEEGLFACGAHSDYGMITLLLTDDTPGLQIQANNNSSTSEQSDGGDETSWIDVPPQEGLFIVNLGDMLERWTNGIFRSTKHRVLTVGDRDRYSIPFFFEPDFDAPVQCLDVCCSEDNPPKFPPTTCGQHILDKYNQTRNDFHQSSKTTS
eukprot:scaffold5088_cov98-Cylindrotheca_fusiformis.AAC.13